MIKNRLDHMSGARGGDEDRLADGLHVLVEALAVVRTGVRPDLLDGYLDRATDHDLLLMGHRVRRPGIVRRWLAAYAAATSTAGSYETIRDAATGGESADLAKTTTTLYRDLLEAMWLVDPLPAWWPLGNPMSRLKRGPKHAGSAPSAEHQSHNDTMIVSLCDMIIICLQGSFARPSRTAPT